MQCIHLSISDQGPLQFFDEVPENFKGPFLAGATVMNLQQDLGTMFIQELTTMDYAIRHTFSNFLRKTIIKGATQGEGLYLRVMRRNKLTHNIKDVGKIVLHETEFSLIRSQGISGSAVFNACKEYETFDCWFSSSLLNKIAPAFPKLWHLLTTDFGKRSMQISKSHSNIDKKTGTVIFEILHCPYADNLLRFYFDTKVNELLLSILFENFKEIKERPISPNHLKAVYKAREIILSKSVGHYTIPQISKMVALNENDLKRAYMQVFGQGLFETYLEKSMQHARELVKGTDKPFKEIAGIAGYKYTSNFSSAFKKRFGETLIECRRNR